MTSAKLFRLTAVILAAVLMLVLFITPAFAEADGAAADVAADVAASAGDTDAKTDKEEKAFNWDLWISVGIIAALIITFFAFYIFSEKWRGKVKQFFRDYKSELKKVVWSPWSDVKKNTVVVLVLSLGTALLIGVLDVIFSKGIHALGSLIK